MLYYTKTGYALDEKGIDKKICATIDSIVYGSDFNTSQINISQEKKTIKLPFMPNKMNYLNVLGFSKAKTFTIANKNSKAVFHILKKANCNNLSDWFKSLTYQVVCLPYNGVIANLQKENKANLFYFDYTPDKEVRGYNKIKGIKGYVYDDISFNGGLSYQHNGIYLINIVSVYGNIKRAQIKRYDRDALKKYDTTFYIDNRKKFNIEYTSASFAAIGLEPIEVYNIELDNDRCFEDIINQVYLHGMDVFDLDYDKDDYQNKLVLS